MFVCMLDRLDFYYNLLDSMDCLVQLPAAHVVPDGGVDG